MLSCFYFICINPLMILFSFPFFRFHHFFHDPCLLIIIFPFITQKIGYRINNTISNVYACMCLRWIKVIGVRSSAVCLRSDDSHSLWFRSGALTTYNVRAYSFTLFIIIVNGVQQTYMLLIDHDNIYSKPAPYTLVCCLYVSSYIVKWFVTSLMVMIA